MHHSRERAKDSGRGTSITAPRIVLQEEGSVAKKRRDKKKVAGSLNELKGRLEDKIKAPIKGGGKMHALYSCKKAEGTVSPPVDIGQRCAEEAGGCSRVTDSIKKTKIKKR